VPKRNAGARGLTFRSLHANSGVQACADATSRRRATRNGKLESALFDLWSGGRRRCDGQVRLPHDSATELLWATAVHLGKNRHSKNDAPVRARYA